MLSLRKTNLLICLRDKAHDAHDVVTFTHHIPFGTLSLSRQFLCSLLPHLRDDEERFAASRHRPPFPTFRIEFGRPIRFGDHRFYPPFDVLSNLVNFEKNSFRRTGMITIPSLGFFPFISQVNPISIMLIPCGCI